MIELRPEDFPDTRRHKEISRLCAYFEGTQYRGRPDFWKGTNASGERVPLRERAPAIVYPLPSAAVRQVVRFTFGEARFPALRVEAVDAENAINGLALSETNAATLEAFLPALIDAGHLKPAMRALMTTGCAMRSAVAILSFQAGTPYVEMPRPHDCAPKFKNDNPHLPVESLVWSYPFQKAVRGADGKITEETYWFRRDINAAEYVAYEDAKYEQGKPLVWTRNEVACVQHELGFCPVVWIRNLAEASCSEIDGVSLFEDQFEQFDALNFTLSQRHRGITIFGVPQPWESGVDDSDVPQADGRSAVSSRGYSNANTKGPLGDVATPARKISPDSIWSYQGDNVKVGLLETSGKAFEVATMHVQDIRARVLEAMSVVLVNAAEVVQKEISGGREMSGKFLELAYAPLLALVDEERDCWWPSGLRRILSMFLRMIVILKGANVLLPNAQAIAKMLAPFQMAFDDGMTWIDPPMKPVWGDYFAPTNDEINLAVQSANAAKGSLIQKKTATHYVAPYFGIDDVDAEVDALNAEADEEQKALMQAAHAAAKAKPAFGKPPA